MTKMNRAENVAVQYADDKNLAVRRSLHEKHSTNRQGFYPWLFENYQFPPNGRILELGCGNAGQWDNGIGLLPEGCTLLLSDWSAGMVETAKKKYGRYKNISYQQIDIQNIPYRGESFDVVIANHMLFHVPDLDGALSEVCRILKRGGVFYSSTNGNGGMRAFLRDALKRLDADTKAFSEELSFDLQNGEASLRKHFSSVERLDYEDSFAITETRDLIDWFKSTLSIASYTEREIDGLFDYFEEIRKKDGAIHIPKECGLFVSAKG